MSKAKIVINKEKQKHQNLIGPQDKQIKQKSPKQRKKEGKKKKKKKKR